MTTPDGTPPTGPEETPGGTPPTGPEETPGAAADSPPPPPPKPGLVATLKAIGEALRPLGRRRVLAASATVVILGFGGLFLFSGFSFWWTSQPSFCAKCHPMQKYVDAWEKAPHSEVNCEECHLTPGLFGFIGGKIAGLQVVMNYVRGNYEDYSFNAAVGNAACLKCHEGIMTETIHSTDTGILVSHKDIIETGGKCMACHSTVGHGDAVPFGSQTHPTMATCLKCHDDRIAPLDCDLCHVGKKPSSPPPSIAAEHPSIPPPEPSMPAPAE